MIQDTQATYMSQRAHLLADPLAHDAFGQVAAFASLHVGVTAVILGIAWWNRLRRTTIALSVFLVGTMVATVYLGWHFAVDDVAGLGIAALSWWLAPRTVGVRRRPGKRSRRLHLRFIPSHLRSGHAQHRRRPDLQRVGVRLHAARRPDTSRPRARL